MASKSLGVLTLDLVAKTGGFIQGMDKAERGSKKWRRQVDSDLKAVKNTLAATAAAATAATAVWIKSSLASAQAFNDQAQLANAGLREFQLYAAGAKTVGIENDKLADILKDVNDRIGDFIQTGGGPMADFFENIAPLVGVTADEFARLSGPEALQLYVSSLERAGLSQQEMMFYLEAMASDASALIPLLQNSGKEMRRLGDEADRLGGIMDEEAIENAKELERRLDLLGTSLTAVGLDIADGVMPQLNELVDMLSDPQTVEGLTTLANGVVSAFDSATQAISTTVSVVQFLGEEFAAVTQGIAANDIVRIQDGIKEIEDLLADDSLIGLGERLRFFGPDGIVEFYSEDELKAELARLKTAKDAYYETQTALAGLTDREGFQPEQSNVDNSPSFARLATTKAERELREEREKAAKALQDLFADTLDGYQRQLALIDATTEAEKVRYEIESGNLVGINDEQQKRLIGLAEELDAQTKLMEQQEEAAQLQEDTNERARQIAQDLKSEEQQVRDSYEERRKIILDATNLTAQERSDAMLALEQELQEDLVETSGTYWERYLLGVEKNFESMEGIAGEALDNLSSRFGDAFESMIFDSDNLGDAIYNLANGMARSMTNAIGQMIAQWMIYNAVQSAALGGAGNTVSFGSFVTGAFSGQAHDGLMEVPSTGTYLLEQGERVTTADTSAKLDNTLDRVQQDMRAGGGTGGAGKDQNIRIVNAFDTGVIGDYLGSSEGERHILNVVSRNQTALRRA